MWSYPFSDASLSHSSYIAGRVKEFSESWIQQSLAGNILCPYTGRRSMTGHRSASRFTLNEGWARTDVVARGGQPTLGSPLRPESTGLVSRRDPLQGDEVGRVTPGDVSSVVLLADGVPGAEHLGLEFLVDAI